jgi:hypothetical protein
MEVRNVTRGKWRIKLFQFTVCIGVKLDQLTFDYFNWTREEASLKTEHHFDILKKDPRFDNAKSYIAKPMLNNRRKR